MSDIDAVAPKVTYAIQTTSIDFYDQSLNENRGRYATKTELKARMTAGKKVNKNVSLGRQVDTLEDVRVLVRAAELGGSYNYNDPMYDDGEEGTRIVTRKIVKIEEIV